jgi:hypothetical protein
MPFEIQDRNSPEYQLPLSFVAGIFSMNAKEINGYTGRTAGAIVTIMRMPPSQLPFMLNAEKTLAYLK